MCMAYFHHVLYIEGLNVIMIVTELLRTVDEKAPSCLSFVESDDSGLIDG